MRKDKGVTLVEILVSSLILVLVAGASMASYVSVKQLSVKMAYYYTAWNLIRIVLEFGETNGLDHEFRLKYYYPAATSCTIPDTGCTGMDSNATEGYRLKEWWNFTPADPDPFDYLGNILQNGLVPVNSPNSVEIYYYVEQDSNLYDTFKETVEVAWRGQDPAKVEKVVASVVPIRQVNNQLQLSTIDFWWE